MLPPLIHPEHRPQSNDFVLFFVLSRSQAQHRDTFIEERYGKYNISDPLMALQRDSETLKEKNDGGKQPVCTNPLSILKVVMKQCKNMQERMLSQLAAAESRHRKVGSPIGRCVLRESSEASGNNVSYPVRHQVSWDSDGAGDLLGIKRSFSDTGARGAQKEHRWLHGFSLRNGQTFLQETFLLVWHSRTLGAFYFQIPISQTLATVSV